MYVGDSRGKTGKRTFMVRRGSACVVIFPKGFWILLTTKVSLRRKEKFVHKPHLDNKKKRTLVRFLCKELIPIRMGGRL